VDFILTRALDNFSKKKSPVLVEDKAQAWQSSPGRLSALQRTLVSEDLEVDFRNHGSGGGFRAP